MQSSEKPIRKLTITYAKICFEVGGNRVYYGAVINTELGSAQKDKLNSDLCFCRITWKGAVRFHLLALTVVEILFPEKWYMHFIAL